VCFISDDNYVKYCYTAILSMIKNAHTDDELFIHILSDGISKENEKILLSLKSDKHDIEIIVSTLENMYDKSLTPTVEYMCKHKWLIPNILSHLDKVLYLDCDIIVEGDVLELFSLDLEGNHVACVQDFIIVTTKRYIPYLKNTLKLSNYKKYFNSGVMVFDIDVLKNTNFLADCFTILQSLDKPKWPDQDVLNIIFQGKTLYLDKKWNYFSATKPFSYKNYELIKYDSTPRIIHFIGSKKPWAALQTPIGERFWHYAEKTPCYAELVQGLLQYLPDRLILARKKRALYALLSYIPLASVSKKYTEKKLSYEYEISATECFLREHALET